MDIREELRSVSYGETNIEYLFKRKPVKNLNLRINEDCSVVVSANDNVDVGKVDAFVIAKGEYILSSIQRFEIIEAYEPSPKKYVSGESFYILGRGVRLKVQQGEKDSVLSDGIYLYLTLTDLNDYSKREKLVKRYLDKECRVVFEAIIQQIYPVFQKYNVNMPELRIRDMKTRWGSCSPSYGVITLNKTLLKAPRDCIEYVVLHEFCHFVHLNHSKAFYSFVTMLMPDWKERKIRLDKIAAHGL